MRRNTANSAHLLRMSPWPVMNHVWSKRQSYLFEHHETSSKSLRRHLAGTIARTGIRNEMTAIMTGDYGKLHRLKLVIQTGGELNKFSTSSDALYTSYMMVIQRFEILIGMPSRKKIRHRLTNYKSANATGDVKRSLKNSTGSHYSTWLFFATPTDI